MRKEHVLKHYPQGTLHSFDAPCEQVSDVLAKFSQGATISLLALDIEGIDAEVLLSIEWSDLACDSVSFEVLHLGSSMEDVKRVLVAAGFVPAGDGLDPSGYDRLFVRPKSVSSRIRCFLREHRRRLAQRH